MSEQINRDKDQLRDVMGLINDYGCNTGSSTVAAAVCNNLRNKERALTARINENVQEARDQGCTVE